jgi:hypothetical protein
VPILRFFQLACGALSHREWVRNVADDSQRLRAYTLMLQGQRFFLRKALQLKGNQTRFIRLTLLDVRAMHFVE